jgi:Transcriptional regulatory protein, C terminal
MNVSLSTEDFDLFNAFEKEALQTHDNLVNAKVENVLFKNLMTEKNDAYILCNDLQYCQKAVDVIKKKYPYIPVAIINICDKVIEHADIYLFNNSNPLFIKSVFSNIRNYKTNFDKLAKLSIKNLDIINFADCIFDPTRRLLIYKDVEIKKLSAKECGIIEILGTNLGKVVKREIILEKIWLKNDYFKARSLDVYVTGLRKLFKKYKIDLTIKNIRDVGLIME